MCISFRMRLLPQAAIFTMRYFYGSTYCYINDAVTTLCNNFSTTQCTQWRKYRRFLTSISRFEDVLDMKYVFMIHYYQTHDLL